MNSIRFSQQGYIKLPYDASVSRLLEVFKVKTDVLHEAFVEYDTTYLVDVLDVNGETRRYTLPKGKVLVLLLLSPSGELWTTIRRYTPRKYEYYMRNRGKFFDIVFTEGGDRK